MCTGHFIGLTAPKFNEESENLPHIPAPVAQLEERPLREWEVVGSSHGLDIPKSLKMVLAAPCLALRLRG